jgi:leucyl/phenylalanyl-tRNA--protein transferase
MALRDLPLDPPPPEADFEHPNAETLLWAYRNTLFPMGDARADDVGWYSPDPRSIIPLDTFHVPRRLEREVRRCRFDVRSDTAFEAVMRACAPARSAQNGQWITAALLPSYLELHRLGHAHSVEAWLDGDLVGGLYGVHIGGAFFGESMFNRPDLGGTNASKVCLVMLVHWLKAQGFQLLDTQFSNPHMEQFGCERVPRDRYWRLLRAAVTAPVVWGQFRPLPGPA